MAAIKLTWISPNPSLGIRPPSSLLSFLLWKENYKQPLQDNDSSGIHSQSIFRTRSIRVFIFYWRSRALQRREPIFCITFHQFFMNLSTDFVWKIYLKSLKREFLHENQGNNEAKKLLVRWRLCNNFSDFAIFPILWLYQIIG